MFEYMETAFELGTPDIADYSPLTLAYIGDSVYELIIRTKLVFRGNAPVNTLNKEASGLAKAATQSAIIENVMDMLTDEEQAAYRRGRNAHSFTKAKNATAGDYRRATGFEALIGWLYMQKRFERIMEIVKAGFNSIGENKNEI